MKKKLQLIFILMCCYTLNAQNLLPDDISGFEGEDSGWWIQHKDVFEFSKKKYNSGEYSLKVFKTTYNDIGKNVNIHYRNAFPKGLKSGKYRLSAKVLVSRNAPKGFGFNLKGKDFKNIYMSFEDLPRNKWVDISKVIEIKKSKVIDAVISISKNKNYGGYGLFYIDDVFFEKIE